MSDGKRVMREVVRLYESRPQAGVWLHSVKVPIRDASKKSPGAVAWDVTATQTGGRTEEEGQGGRRDRQQRQEPVLANMSHELRTPAERHHRLQRCAGGGRRRPRRGIQSGVPDLQKSIMAAKHQLALINDIPRPVEDLEGGQDDPSSSRTSRCRGRPICRGNCAALLVAKKNGNQLRVQCPSHLGRIRVRPEWLRQILLNLLSNSASSPIRASSH